MSQTPIRVLLVDDQVLLRTGFRMVLAAQPDMEVVAEAGDGAEAIDILRATRADVVLMDVRMPRLDGVEATRRICAAGPDAPKVLILTTFDLDEYAFSGLKAGASGFLLKDVPPGELLNAIRAVHSGDAVVAPSTTRRLLDRFSPMLPSGTPEPQGSDIGRLTEREREVMLLVAQGLSNGEIAGRLFVSEATVKTHVGRILTKLGLRDRVQVVVLAYETGLVRAGGGAAWDAANRGVDSRNVALASVVALVHAGSSFEHGRLVERPNALARWSRPVSFLGADVAWTEHMVVRDGVRLACWDWGGPGQPLVLLHGLAGHAGEWDVLAERLRFRYRVVAVDQRGHGMSERHPQDASRAAYVADVIAVADQLALQRPALVGQSPSGHTAMLAAAAHPGRVRALVLVEAGPGGPNPNGPVTIRRWLDSWPTPFPSREAAAAFLGGGPVGAGWAAGLEEREDGWWPRFDRDLMIRSVAENAQRSLREWEQVACPSLVVLAQSGFVSAREVDEMLRKRPATTAMSIPGTGHDLHLERPEILQTALSDFLDGLAWNAHAVTTTVAPLVSFEDYARYEHAYANALIPALLQTRAYVEALHRTPDVRLDTEAVEARVEARMRRQEIFDRADAPDSWAILDEAVLWRPVGTPEVMAQQIAHIQEMSERPNVGVQILPFTRGAHAAGSGGHFVLLGRDDEGTPLDSLHVVYLELPRKGIYLDTPSDIHAYRVMYDYLRSTAADPASSSALLEAARQEYSS